MLGGHHYQLQSRLTDQSYHRIIRQLHGKYTAVQQVSKMLSILNAAVIY